MFTRSQLTARLIKQGLIVTSIVLVLVAGIIAIGKQISNIERTLETNRVLVARLESQGELMATIDGAERTIGTNGAHIIDAFIVSDNILEFLSALESLALAERVEQRVKFETPIPSPLSPTLSTIPFTISLSANSYALVSYLRAFEKLPYITRIEGIQVIAPGVTGWNTTSTITLKGSLETRKESITTPK